MTLTVGSCFSGIGGFELGLERTGGFKTKWQIEIDPYASAVLAKHWPDAKRFRDITAVDGGVLEPVDVICGGFPCQDVSFAGKRAGLGGKRTTLWTELIRLVREVKPRWFVGENVPGLLSANDGRFFGNILRDLADSGFDAEWGVLSAAGVGAPHLRRRVFILAHAAGRIRQRQAQGQAGHASLSGENVADTKKRPVRNDSENIGAIDREINPPFNASMACREKTISDTSSNEGRISDGDGEVIRNAPGERLSDWTVRKVGGPGAESELERSNWWSTEPDVGRVAHGVPSRVDRLKCLGNAIVPQVAEKVGEIILQHERRTMGA